VLETIQLEARSIATDGGRGNSAGDIHSIPLFNHIGERYAPDESELRSDLVCLAWFQSWVSLKNASGGPTP
jgi:hypothetical protein